MPRILTISNRYPVEEELPWAASSSPNHKVPFRDACESAHALSSFLHFIFIVTREDAAQVFRSGGEKLEKHI